MDTSSSDIFTVTHNILFILHNISYHVASSRGQRSSTADEKRHLGSPGSSVFFLNSSRHCRFPGFSRTSLLLRNQKRKVMRMMKSPMAVRKPRTSGETGPEQRQETFREIHAEMLTVQVTSLHTAHSNESSSRDDLLVTMVTASLTLRNAPHARSKTPEHSWSPALVDSKLTAFRWSW